MHLTTIFFLLCLHSSIYFTSVSGLLESTFDALRGYAFCTYGSSSQFKELCERMADEMGYEGYIESYLEDLECEEKTVYVTSDDDGSYVQRSTYLLLCAFNWEDGSQNLEYLGDGYYTNDVLVWSPDDDGDLTCDGNYSNKLSGIFD